MEKLIIKLEHFNSEQLSKEGVKINKIVSSISPKSFIKLLYHADNKVNPRKATDNPIVKSITETLDVSPELFWLKSKGILLSTESCILLDRGRVKVSLSNFDYEGIMDGGHNAFAIARFIAYKIYNITFKKWDECKSFWAENYDDILSKFDDYSSDFKFSIPIEIIYPSQDDDALDQYYDLISEICSARNNNVQLTVSTRGNQTGIYDLLKEVLFEETKDIKWRGGEDGKIKPEDIISLASLPLHFLQQNNLLPKDVKTLSKISVYSQKSKCVLFFNEVIEHKDVSNYIDGKYVIHNKLIKSAIKLTIDIIKFFDLLYIEFPNLYNKVGSGRFAGINGVKPKKTSAPFGTTDRQCDVMYGHGFFYPLVCGLTNLIKYDEQNDRIEWTISPDSIQLNGLYLSQYIEMVKGYNRDPQKIGKSIVFYNEAENVFDRVTRLQN